MTKVPTKSNRQENELDSQLIQKENGMSENVLQSIKAVMSKPSDIYKLFFLFIKRLDKFFPISQSSLILHSQKENKLKVIAMKGEKGTRKGLALTLPEKDSLFYKVFHSNNCFIQHHPEKFECSFIEQKILKDDTALSMAILPIFQDKTKHGLICLSSPEQDAFVSFENGQLDEVLMNFNKYLIKKIPTINI